MKVVYAALVSTTSALAIVPIAATAQIAPAPAGPQAQVLLLKQAGGRGQADPATPAADSEIPAGGQGIAPDRALTVAGDIVVTGSRLVSRGYTQPTPTTTITMDDINRAAQPNVFQTIRQLPALQGSSGRQTRGNSASSGQQGLSSFSLRGLGEVRTLTLLDGQRFTPANFTGVPDISQFPQLLIERVDVVTGGASASYGSDAVGGVINFVTNKRFKGVRANVETGITTYGDDKNLTAQIAWGDSFADDRLHVEVSGEYSYEGGTPVGDYGVTGGVSGRKWYTAPGYLGRPISATTDGKPLYTRIEGAQAYQYAKFGLITSGPLQGTAFGANGVPYQFQYGSNGVPLKNGQVTGCFSPFCVGGDLSGQIGQSASLASQLERGVGYGRVGYEIGDGTELYGTVTLARVLSRNFPPRGAERTGLTIQCDNAFLPSSIRDACYSNKITSFQFGTSSGQFTDPLTVHTRRDLKRFVLGIEGKASIAGTDWRYSAYGAYGISTIAIDVLNNPLQPHFNAAIDAVAGPNGTIVCRSAVARDAGCVPFNIFGDVTNSAAAYAYVTPANGSQQRSRQQQTVFSFSVTGEPAATWAGPIAVAFGVEGRDERYHTTADPYGNGVGPDSPNSVNYPSDPLLNTSIGNNWYSGNYKSGRGRYDVKEAFAEINVPFVRSAALGEANVNAAFRVTDYSTSGTVEAWKVGGVWKTPINGLRFRTVTSRDVRAPNLSELFAAEIVTNNTVNFRGNNINIQNRVTGNRDLQPEVARNTEVGLVLNEPKWFRGFSLSVDYYTISLKKAIVSLTAQQIVDLCDAGSQDQCAKTLLTSTVPGANYVNVTAFNAGSIQTNGLDIEASYRVPLSGIGLPGNITVRGLATRVFKLVTNSGVIGSIPVDTAGVNSGSTPDWKGLLTQSWDTDRFSLTVAERFISAGVFSNEWIQCQTNCPVATSLRPTVDDNSIPGAVYVDLGGSYKLTSQISAYFRIDNLLDKDPAMIARSVVNTGANSLLYDTLGRMFRLGVRTQF